MAVLLVIALYFIPTIIALARSMPNTGSVAVINLLLGWTVIGWIVALAMSVGAGRPSHVSVNISQPGMPPRRIDPPGFPPRLPNHPARQLPSGPPPAGPPAGLSAELQRLHALHQEGVLTAEEFAAAKRHLLGGGGGGSSPEDPTLPVS